MMPFLQGCRIIRLSGLILNAAELWIYVIKTWYPKTQKLTNLRTYKLTNSKTYKLKNIRTYKLKT